MKKFFITTLAIFFISVLFGAETAYAGFGVTPPYVRTDRLTNNSEYVQEIILVRGDPAEDLKAEVTINVPGADEWISIDRGNEFVLPKGESKISMKVHIKVPENVEYGTYTGNIRIRTSSLEQAQSGVSIALGAQIDVDLRVVDEIADFEVRRVALSELEEGHSVWWLDYPGRITFAMHIENTGNVEVAPSKVRFDIYDRQGVELLESVENTNKIDRVKPFETKKVEAYLPTRLSPGGYLVKYYIYKRDTIVRSGELTLSILPEDKVPGYEPYGFDGLSGADKASIIVPPFVLVASVFGFIWGGRRLRISRKIRRRQNSGPNGGRSPIDPRRQPLQKNITQNLARTNQQTSGRSDNVVRLSRRKKQ